MPYEVKPKEGEFCVYNSETGEEKACHDTEEKAKQQVALLHHLERDEE